MTDRGPCEVLAGLAVDPGIYRDPGLGRSRAKSSRTDSGIPSHWAIMAERTLPQICAATPGLGAASRAVQNGLIWRATFSPIRREITLVPNLARSRCAY
jgi:hypothetical protein